MGRSQWSLKMLHNNWSVLEDQGYRVKLTQSLQVVIVGYTSSIKHMHKGTEDPRKVGNDEKNIISFFKEVATSSLCFYQV